MLVLVAETTGLFCLVSFLFWAGFVWPTLPLPGAWLFTAFAFFLPYVTVAALVGIFVTLRGVRDSHSRAQALRKSILCATFVAASVAGIWVGRRHRMDRMAVACANAMPLVAGIEAFERHEGRAPSGLAELVPRYLPAIPSTGMSGYPEWDYISEPDALQYGGNQWVVRVFTPTPGPGFNFDQLLYFPNQRYPERGHGGSIERVGRCGYVHE
jgi:hypothetical protein